MSILIKGGRVINPATQMEEEADVLIEEDKVVEMKKNIEEKADRVLDASGCYVMPGFIDMHVHFRDPGFEQKEDIYTGMEAAAHGGYTTVLTMPNTKPVVDNADVVNYVHNKAKAGNCIHVLQVGAVTKGQMGKELADIKGMVEAGIPAISEAKRIGNWTRKIERQPKCAVKRPPTVGPMAGATAVISVPTPIMRPILRLGTCSKMMLNMRGRAKPTPIP